MKDTTTGVISLIEKALSAPQPHELEEVGTVIGVGDGICKIYGLTKAIYGELIEFESGNRGIVMDLDEEYISVVLLHSSPLVVEQEIAKRTSNVFTVPVGAGLIGRVISPTGNCLDTLEDIVPEAYMPLEQIAPSIIERTPVNESLHTGCTAVDALIPIGKGQRELLIGNRSTGKTSLALDIIMQQQGKDVICIYVAIGGKQSDTARIIHLLTQHNALSYSIVMDASAKCTALEQFIAPYAACTIGEHFMKQGKDVLIIYDDLSNHAIAYRELSLLLRRPPGREAYPGDIFYIHSRLLERGGKLAEEHGGGSMTTLPIIQTQSDDISAYIPTNLISITDGQIFFDTNLFNNGIRPAINIGLSVSRIGGAAQTKAMKKVASSLKLELAQYESLMAFTQFGSELDITSQKAIDRGARAVELLKQELHDTYSLTDEVLMLFLLKENYLDKLELSQIQHFTRQFCSFLQEMYPETYTVITKEKELSTATQNVIKGAADEFMMVFIKPPKQPLNPQVDPAEQGESNSLPPSSPSEE